MRAAEVEQHECRPRILRVPVISHLSEEAAVVVTVLELRIEADRPLAENPAEMGGGQIVQGEVVPFRHAAVGRRQQLLDGVEMLSGDGRPWPGPLDHLEDAVMLGILVDAVEDARRGDRPEDPVELRLVHERCAPGYDSTMITTLS